jgi:hypothetical protein
MIVLASATPEWVRATAEKNRHGMNKRNDPVLQQDHPSKHRGRLSIKNGTPQANPLRS